MNQLKGRQKKRKQSPNRNPSESSWVVVEHAIDPQPFSADWFALNFLKEWTPEDLAIAIKKNVQIDLSTFASMIEDMVVNKILEWFRVFRPDLYTVLNSPEGLEWLRRNVKTILS